MMTKKNIATHPFAPLLRVAIFAVGIFLVTRPIFADASTVPMAILTGNQNARWNVSNLTLSTYRAEFRLENVQQSSINRFVYGTGDYPLVGCYIMANTLTLSCNFNTDGAGQGAWIYNLTAGQDVRIRYQRDPTNAIGTLETWNGDCTNYSKRQEPITVIAPPYSWTGSMDVSPNIQLGFLRLYSFLDNNADCPEDAPSAVADLADFRFQNSSSSDVSGNGYHLTDPTATFVASPTYSPLAVISGWTSPRPVFRAGVPFTLSGAHSFHSGGSITGYAWSQVAGPNTATIANSSNAVVSITTPTGTLGQYTFRLTVTADDGTTGFVDQVVGVVNADAKGVVAPPGELGGILGPVLMEGESPWPWYDATEIADADALAIPYEAALSEASLPGTVSVLVGSGSYNTTTTDWQGNVIAQSGSNNSFGAGIVLTGDGSTNFSSSLVGKNIYLHWDARGDGSMAGRAVIYVAKVIDSHTLLSASYYSFIPLDKSVNMSVGEADSDFAGYNSGSQADYPDPWNYYDALLGIYRLYYRTGLTQYLTEARSFCNNWWTYGLNNGYQLTIPRNSGWQSMMACAADNHPDWWPGIANSVGYEAASVSQSNSPVNDSIALAIDPRESSYILRASALLAQYYPSHSSNGASVKNQWCTMLDNQLQNFWLPRQEPEGYWQEDLMYWNVGFPLGKLNGRWGTAPWRGVGLAALGLIQAYDEVGSGGPCANPSIASALYSGGSNPSGAISKAANFIWNYGRSPDGGLYANVLYSSREYPGAIDPSSMPTGSSVSVALGNSDVIGSGGTKFLTTFAPCNGTTYIGITGNSYPENDVYQVVSCADDSHLTIGKIYDHSSVSMTQYSKSNAADTSCTPSLAGTCEPDEYSGRNLSFDAAASAAWMYAQTADSTWKDRVEYYMGKEFGGAAGGAGSLGMPVGPYADGGTGNFGDILPSCNIAEPPCGDNFLSTMEGKQFGQAAGAGNVAVALAEISSPITVIAAPPSISSVSAAPGTSTALVSWMTDIPADSQVEWGTTASFGSLSSPQDAGGATSHAVLLTGLSPGTLYYYAALSADPAGDLATSQTGFFTTASTSPASASSTPAAPTGLAASAATQSSVSLSWAAPSGTVAWYGVIRDGTEVGTTTLLSYLDAGLSPGSSFAYAVRAYGARGDASPDSASVRASTQGAPSSGGGGGGGGGSPAAPTYPSASASFASASSASPSPASSLAALLEALRRLALGLLASSNNGRNLSVGSRGTDVWALQVWLGVSGSGPASQVLLAEGPTGGFDLKTRAALAEWQGANGISPAYGFFGPRTRSLIEGVAQAVAAPQAISASPTSAASPAITSASSPGPFTKNLTVGSTGSQVSTLQRFLAKDPALYQGKASGIYDQATSQAVQAFQLIAGIDVPPTDYGSFDAPTRAKLNQLFEQGGTP